MNALARRILNIHRIAHAWQPSNKIEPFLDKISDIGSTQRVGDFVRGVIYFFDEKANEYGR